MVHLDEIGPRMELRLVKITEPSDKTSTKQQDFFIPIPDNTGLVKDYESLYSSN